MIQEVENILCKIGYLTAKKQVAEKDKLFNSEYVTLLIHLKAHYNALVSYYLTQNDHIYLCQTLVLTANTLFELFSVSPSQIKESELNDTISRLLDATKNCYDLNLCRSSFVAIGKLYYCLDDYINAEKYVLSAYEDFDYSLPTFQLLIKILDKQEKYLLLLSIMQDYLNMGVGYHERCSFRDFDTPNTMKSVHKSAYMSLFDNYMKE